MDTRELVQVLKDHNELVEVNEEVDWNYEIPAMELLSGRVNGPAFLFNNIKGIKQGEGRVLAGHFSGSYRLPHRRQAMLVGLDPDITSVDYSQELAKRMSSPIRPIEVASGSCKEVVVEGKDVNLFNFPFTFHAIGDGGRYCFQQQTIIKDPDSDWMNVGHYCMEIFSKRRAAITPYAESNFRLIYHSKYEARNQPMPIALVIGGDPVCYLVATAPLPPGVSEYDAAGGVRGTPLELVKCETSDLLVPANAEMVIEGEVRPYETLPEGPKPESFGFSAGPRQEYIAVRINCITHRKNPVLLDLHQGLGGGGTSLCDASFRVGTTLMTRMMGFPFKSSTWYTYFGGTCTVMSAKKRLYPEPYPGYRQDLEDSILASPVLACMSNEIVVDPDISAYDWDQILEAMMTQTNAARDVRITYDKHQRMTLESPWAETEDLTKYHNMGHIYSKHLYVDSTAKEDMPMGVPRTEFETLFPADLQQKVVDNWEKWGFKTKIDWHKKYNELEYI
ncbi:UbiD family decarboxylase [Desulfobacterium sp. N47]|uniref:3-octaprenyl-4-hydroxybenzoate carboxy-lyase n=1 Tax=uncultured Desulfobacterium sp. TaxID=201089 RepID=E1YIW6_9BACT|nr:hypothetical protein N47_K27500 [uncultured Desulfobacterium sp.]